MRLAVVLKKIIRLVLEGDELDERLAPGAREHALETVNETGEAESVEMSCLGGFDEICQLLSKLGYNIGHDLAYAHGEAPSSLDASGFGMVTCVQYEGASPLFTQCAKTTSGRTYTP